MFSALLLSCSEYFTWVFLFLNCFNVMWIVFPGLIVSRISKKLVKGGVMDLGRWGPLATAGSFAEFSSEGRGPERFPTLP